MPHKTRWSWRLKARCVVMTLALLATSLSFKIMFSHTPANEGERAVANKRKFTILDPKAPARQQKELNVLQKPFQWYRDHWSDHSQTNTNYTTIRNSWEATNLPKWIKDYFSWHQQETQRNNPNAKYLLVQCLQQDRQCGGLADRLLPLPFYVLLAAQTQRLLVIVWTVPFPLEEFFLPHDIDWMLPTVLYDGFMSVLNAPSIKDKTVFSSVPRLMDAVLDTDIPIVRARIQDYTTAWEYYDQYHREEERQLAARPSFAMQHYRQLFDVFFQPSPPLLQAMQGRNMTLMESSSSSPYAIAHYRALYGPQNLPSTYIHAAARNAANCASQLLPKHRIFVLSDSIEALKSLQQYKPNVVTPIIGSRPTENALHLDKATREKELHLYKPPDFYDVFLDVLTMANAECVSYGQGGFGKLGSLLSRNATCSNRHFDQSRMVPCVWKG